MGHGTQTTYGSKPYGGHPEKTTLRRLTVGDDPLWGGDAFPRRVVLPKSLFLKDCPRLSATCKDRTRKTTLGPRAAADATPPNGGSGLRQRPLADLGEAHAR